MLKDAITQLYSKEGRSISYIYRLLGIDRHTLSTKIKKEWKLKPAPPRRHLTASNQKFANKHRELIKSRLDNNITIHEIAKELGVQPSYISKTIASGDDVIRNAIEEYHARMHNIADQRTQGLKESSSRQYLPHIDNENWHEITGHEGYFVSRYGQVARYCPAYDEYLVMKPEKNCRSGYMYVKFGKKGFSVHRLVAIYFVDGRTKEKNTVSHIDGDKNNNRYDNLEWTTQSDNNAHAYAKLNRVINRGKKYNDIILDNKYHFKTITALAKFLGISWTQTNRYITGECKSDHIFQVH